ncbi:hypothetical protein BUE93_06605 [Chromobacterium amazonense]|uniref:Uncharacterized protein n=1 Tax=Chromobacterium amazonense TaxID=1382803 RepID=A0A2S9X6W7_9NEIS|nr:hypothetical protein BUE93_06605 [Chromobacterium amazonense]
MQQYIGQARATEYQIALLAFLDDDICSASSTEVNVPSRHIRFDQIPPAGTFKINIALSISFPPRTLCKIIYRIVFDLRQHSRQGSHGVDLVMKITYFILTTFQRAVPV